MRVSPAISKWQQSLNNFLFSNLVVLFAGSKRECFGNPCGGCGVSPPLSASSQHLYLGLLQVVSIFNFHTYDLDVVSDVAPDVVPHLYGIPSKQLKPRIGRGGAVYYEPRIAQYIAENYVYFQLRCSKTARCCGAKHISKPKCTKRLVSGSLLEVQIYKKCTPLWREAHFQVKMLKTPGVRTTFGSCDVEKVHAVVVSKSKCT
jgi:hypothetical protein